MPRYFHFLIAPALLCAAGPASAQEAWKQTLSFYEQAAKASPGFTGFSAPRGETLFRSRAGGGKPDTPSCTTCHGENPAQSGKTRAGKEIEPLALSATPTRYGDVEKTEKWFSRNCASVLGRECTPQEKGDFLAFMTRQ